MNYSHFGELPPPAVVNLIMHEPDAPDIVAFLRAAGKWMGDELELSQLVAGDRLLVRTHNTHYLFLMTGTHTALLTTDRPDRPSGHVQIQGCVFGQSRMIKPGHLFCGGGMEVLLKAGGMTFTTAPIKAIQLVKTSLPLDPSGQASHLKRFALSRRPGSGVMLNRCPLPIRLAAIPQLPRPKGIWGSRSTCFGRVGRSLGVTRSEAQVGQSAMSAVWRAHDELLDKAVALKFLAEVVARDAVAVDDLRQKTARARLLAHPNIVRVNDFMRDNTLATVSMEYVGGATLAQLRIEQPGRVFSTKAIPPLVEQLCPAIDYAHDVAGTVHGSLKPSNILITPEGIVKITDFGIAGSLAEARHRLLGRTERVYGSMFYMSPQQLDGAPPSPADDIYAFGAIFYELIAGEPPFSHCDTAAQIRTLEPVAMAVLRAESGMAADPIPPAWENAVLACLAKDPARRPSSGEEIMCLFGLAERKFVSEERSLPQDAIRAKILAPPPATGSAAPYPLAQTVTPVPSEHAAIAEVAPQAGRPDTAPRDSENWRAPKKRSLIDFLLREESEGEATEQISAVKEPEPAVSKRAGTRSGASSC